MNKVVLCGRLTKDVDLRQSGETAIARFNVACDKKGEGADFPSCVAFNKTAETISQYLRKGNKILIDGHLQTGSYEDKNGNKVYTTDVIVDRFEFVESKSEQPKSVEATVGGDGFMNIPDGIAEDLPFN